jgi:probable HAF family extracellular repeat protein
MTDLGTLGGTDSVAFGINDRGQVAGYAFGPAGSNPAGFVHAFLWLGGTTTDLGTLGGTYSVANGINDRGQVVGVSSTASGLEHAFL